MEEVYNSYFFGFIAKQLDIVRKRKISQKKSTQQDNYSQTICDIPLWFYNGILVSTFWIYDSPS